MQITFTSKPQIVLASQVQVPDYMKVRATTGIEWFDQALGSPEKPGYVIGSVFVVAASPGAGKSTLLRQMCSMSVLGTALYNTGEECFEQVSMSLEERRFDSNFLLANYREVNELLAAVKARPDVRVLVIDSLQNLYSETDHQGNPLGGAPGSKKQIVCVAEKIAAFCKETLVTAFMICHSTKSGDFSGPQTLEHVVDGSIKITAVDELRSLTLEKNRWGLSGRAYYLGMSEHGFTIQDAPEGAERRGGKESKMDIARRLKSENDGIEKEDFIEMLISETGCGASTASTYWYSAR